MPPVQGLGAGSPKGPLAPEMEWARVHGTLSGDLFKTSLLWILREYSP